MEKKKEELKAKIDKIENPVHLQLLLDFANVKFDSNYEGLTPGDAAVKMYRREQLNKLRNSLENRPDRQAKA